MVKKAINVHFNVIRRAIKIQNEFEQEKWKVTDHAIRQTYGNPSKFVIEILMTHFNGSELLISASDNAIIVTKDNKVIKAEATPR